jgi:prepilin-type N-terminal cleavage/methylation domain-containing protein
MRKGFTLIELMVVVLIVAVLAAVLVPMMTARLEAARWSEGKAGAGTIATAIRAMAAEAGEGGESGVTFPTGTPLSTVFVNAQDLEGKYFDNTCYQLSNVALTPAGTYPVTYTITVLAPGTGAATGAPGASLTWNISNYTLTEDGVWTETK